MRLLPTSLASIGFTVVVGAAGLGCSSDAPGNPGGGGNGSTSTAGSGTVPTAGTPGVSTAGSGGAPATGTAGSGTSTAGTNSGLGGSNNVAGSSNVAGTSNGTAGSGNATSTGGTTGTAGGGNPGGGAANPDGPDQMGKTNAKPGSMTSTKFDYLKMGEIRLLNNNWGSAAFNCNAPMSVFINADKSFGWSFDRGNCDTGNTNQKPDFPQIEFGIHPFGLGSSEATSPNFSSTTLLPKQIKDITKASVTLEGLNINLSKEGSWDITFEFWLSKQDPATTQGNAGVYAELMTFWGWQNNRWPLTGMTGANSPTCDIGCTTGLSAGTKSYDLLVQRNTWGSGWKYFQFRGTDGSKKTFDGKVEVKPLLDYLIQKGGATPDMWLTRLEVGSEIDDETKGTVTIKNVIFEVNGQERKPVFGN